MKNASVAVVLLLNSILAQVQSQAQDRRPLRPQTATTQGALLPYPTASSPYSTTSSFNSPPSSSLTLETCYDLATQNYPQIRQKELILRTREYSVANAAKGWLPQVNFTGQATYQSETIAFPFKIPGSNPPVFSKDQYKVQGEVDQTIYDAGAIRYQQQLKNEAKEIQLQSLNVDLYALKDRVNQLFFGILMIDEQLRLNDLQRNDLSSGVEKTQASVNNGTAFRSSLDELKAEVLRADQERTELLASRKAYTRMLSLFINRPLDENSILATPAPVIPATDIKRPELNLFDFQKRAFDIQEQQLRIAYTPKISAFVQGGYGRPTLNLISNDFGFWALGGVRFAWSLSGLYTNKNDKRLLALERINLDLQKETFLFNTRLTLTQQEAQAEKFQDLADQDQQIIELRTSVKTAALAQLQNGVITSHEYVTQVNAEGQARENMALHRIQLLQTQYETKTTSGN
jgi:outer membrane protein TolC